MPHKQLEASDQVGYYELFQVFSNGVENKIAVNVINEWVMTNRIELWALPLILAVFCGTAFVYADDVQLLMVEASHSITDGNFKAAEKQYRAVLKQAPTNPNALYGLAISMYERGKLEESAHLLETLIQKYPSFQPAYYLLGNIYESRGEKTRAKQAYRTYVSIAPTNIPPDPEVRIRLRHAGVF